MIALPLAIRLRYMIITFGVLSLIAGLVFLLAFTATREVTMDLASKGIPVQAIVSETRTSLSHGVQTNWVYYNYTDNLGVKHSGSDTYPFDDFRSITPDAQIAVIYLNDGTETSRTARHQTSINAMMQETPGSVTFTLVTPFIFGMALLVYGLQQSRRFKMMRHEHN